MRPSSLPICHVSERIGAQGKGTGEVAFELSRGQLKYAFLVNVFMLYYISMSKQFDMNHSFAEQVCQSSTVLRCQLILQKTT